MNLMLQIEEKNLEIFERLAQDKPKYEMHSPPEMTGERRLCNTPTLNTKIKRKIHITHLFAQIFNDSNN